MLHVPEQLLLDVVAVVPLSALVKFVAVCVRVYWYCHQSGGTDVVDLPDVLLPEGQYLVSIGICLIRSPVFLVICLMMNWMRFPREVPG